MNTFEHKHTCSKGKPTQGLVNQIKKTYSEGDRGIAAARLRVYFVAWMKKMKRDKKKKKK